jgi:lipopolysaccharide transport system ATP-binding protein
MPSDHQPFSSSETVLEIRDLSKQFQLYAKPIDRLKEALTGKRYHTSHQALDQLSLSLAKGQALGVIGQNGAGKSTLLKLITGVIEPDAGVIRANGRVAGLLELGTGFDLDATGQENIAINGQLLGLSGDEIRQITPEVIAFAELGSFIDSPVRSYSSGMQMRLGFSIAYHARPAAFIVDEALSVGDARFQQKCLQMIREFKKNGGALLFVSHDLNAVKLLCDQVIVLHKGKTIFMGSPEEAVQVYYRTLPAVEDTFDIEDAAAYGKRQVRIVSITWQDQHRQLTIAADAALSKPRSFCKSTGVDTIGDANAPICLASGGMATLTLQIESDIDFPASVGLLIRDRFGQDIFGVNTAMLRQPVSLSASGRCQVQFALTLALAPGRYTATVALHTDTTHIHDCQHWWDNALEFELIGFGESPFSGVCRIDHQVTVDHGSSGRTSNK